VVATLARAFDHASVACVLLGSATGPADEVAALHTTRLEMLLNRMLDTTVRGIVYEAAGTVAAALLHGGGELVRSACERSMIPFALLTVDPADHQQWLAAASSACTSILG
jgi:hypothetical protein